MISITDVVAVIGLCITAFKTGYVIGKNSRKNSRLYYTFCLANNKQNVVQTI